MKPYELALWAAAAVSVGFTVGAITASKSVPPPDRAVAKCISEEPVRARALLALLLPWTATVTQSSPGEMPRTRFYIPRSAR